MKAVCVSALLALCFLPPVCAQRQMIVFDHFNEDGGLPNNSINQIYQDRDGILWMPSFDGLVRYDGYTFTSFRRIHADPATLSDNNVRSVAEDHCGRLWVGTIGSGLNVSDRNKQHFHRLTPPQMGRPGVRSKTIRAIIEDPQHNIWIAGDEGLEIIRYEDSVALPGASMQQVAAGINRLGTPVSFHLDDQQRMWVATTRGLAVYGIADSSLLTPDDVPWLPRHDINDIDQAPDGSIWISARKEGPRFYYLGRDDTTFRPFTDIDLLSASRSALFVFDLDGRIWITVFGEQAYGYDFRDSTVFLISSDNSNIPDERFLRAPSVDHQGNIWIPGAGCYRYNYPRGMFQHLHRFGFHQASTAIASFGDEMWFAYRENGIVRHDLKTGAEQLLTTNTPGPSRLTSDHVAAITGLSNGLIAMAGFGSLMLHDPNTGVTTSTFASGTNRSLLEDQRGRLWMGGIRGLYQFTRSGTLLQMYSLPERFGDGRNFVQGIQADHNGHIWFGTSIKGISRLDPESGEITQYLPETTPGLQTDKVIDLAYANRQMWIGTNAGLVRLDIDTGVFTTYGLQHGIANDHITAVLWTPTGLWMTTYGGVSHFDPATERFSNYNVASGLANRTYYPRCKLLGQDGTVYFGGTQGVDYFKPAELRERADDLSVHLVRFSVDQTEIPFTEIIPGQAMDLRHHDDVLEIEFAAREYATPEYVEYAYRITGLSDRWVHLGSARRALIANLKPGDYVFMARARLPHQDWSPGILQIPLRVAPPFWATWWFRLLAISVIVAAVLGYVRFRERKIREREERKKEVERAMIDLERRALLAQMNPHFIFNAMNSIQQFVAARDIEGALKYLSKFSRLLRFVLSISRENKITLIDEITMIQDYLELERMRFPDKFEYTVDIDQSLDVHTLEIPPFLIQPQVENAIRHGLMNKGVDGRLLVAIERQNGHLKVTVEDNGIGREAARQLRAQSSFNRRSQGLSIVEERLRHINQNNIPHNLQITDLYHPDRTPRGTRVEIFVELD
ncbi:MAG: two-component regulator propeller domain-containing protein [Saprospiraceae bacterium]|nr:two-component regulator propeller domain-containing protein [Saprospiraceae bacterium]